MRKLAILTTAAVALSLPAMAGYNSTQDQKHFDTDAKLIINGANSIEKWNGKKYVFDSDKTSKFELADGGDIMIKKGAVYLMNADGSKFLAPDGPYTTKEGVTFYSDDGDLLRVEAPAQIVYVDADLDMNAEDASEHQYNQKKDARTYSRDAEQYEVDVDADLDTRTRRMNGNQ